MGSVITKEQTPRRIGDDESQRGGRIAQLAGAALRIRQDVLRMVWGAGGGHTPASLSIAEILAVLYHAVLRIDPERPDDPARDRFILSKGHAALALYAVLAQRGYFTSDQLATFGQAGTMLGGHPDMHKAPGVEASTGALGHGLGFGLGMAMAGKLDRKDYRVFVLVGDGECQEGSIWEAAMLAAQRRLDNLTVILDYNRLQALGRIDEIVGLEPLDAKWRAFGWEVQQVDGHSVAELLDVLDNVPFAKGRPNMVIANTVKGKGISFMEDVPIWHFRLPSTDEMQEACAELAMEDLTRCSS